MVENEKAKAGFITKASAVYTDGFLLRAAVQLIPGIGGAMDTLLSGLGAKYQYEKLEHFIEELNERLQYIEELNPIEPTEPLYDLMMQVFSEVIKTRSEEKRKRFANLVANQIVYSRKWDEAETATRLLADLTDLHINLLLAALNAPECNGVFEGACIVMLTDDEIKDARNASAKLPTNISPLFPEISIAVLEMTCSELIGKGLFRDDSIGRHGGFKAMTYMRATEMAQWLMDWIAEPKTMLENNNDVFDNGKG